MFFSKINRTQAAEIDLDLQIRPREGPKTSSVHVNLVQIRSAAPEIFHTQTKKSQTAPKQKLTQFTVCGNNDYVHTTHVPARVHTATLRIRCERLFMLIGTKLRLCQCSDLFTIDRFLVLMSCQRSVARCAHTHAVSWTTKAKTTLHSPRPAIHGSLLRRFRL